MIEGKMGKLIYIILGVLSMGFLFTQAKTSKSVNFTFENISPSQSDINLSDYHGKVILLVNTASKCGFTKQYSELEALYQEYKDKGLVVIGVPSNDFMNQEPGTEEDILAFCQLNYGVTFPLTKKYVVSDKDAHPFFVFATEQLGYWSKPKWNFQKYLIDRQGHLVTYFFPTTSPQSSKLIQAVEKELNK